MEAAVRLALHDDPRGDEVLRGLDHDDEASPYHWLLYDLGRHLLSRTDASPADEQGTHASEEGSSWNGEHAHRAP